MKDGSRACMVKKYKHTNGFCRPPKGTAKADEAKYKWDTKKHGVVRPSAGSGKARSIQSARQHPILGGFDAALRMQCMSSWERVLYIQRRAPNSPALHSCGIRRCELRM